MFRSLLFAIYLVFILFLVSCRQHSADESRDTVVVSIPPQKFIVEQIAGDRFTINILLPPGTNHETFEPNPRDVANLEDAKLYFSIGYLDFEQNWLPRVASSGSTIKIINTSKDVNLLSGHIHEHDPVADHGHDHGTGTDPHTWLSPHAVKMQALAIHDALIGLDGQNLAVYGEYLRQFNLLIDSVDLKIKEILSLHKGRSFMIYHPALAYFARDYGLEQISIEEEGKEPSAGHIRNLIDEAKAKKIKSILVSKEFDMRHAKAIANELDLEVIVFDPLEKDWASNMIKLAKLIAEN